MLIKTTSSWYGDAFRYLKWRNYGSFIVTGLKGMCALQLVDMAKWQCHHGLATVLAQSMSSEGNQISAHYRYCTVFRFWSVLSGKLQNFWSSSFILISIQLNPLPHCSHFPSCSSRKHSYSSSPRKIGRSKNYPDRKSQTRISAHLERHGILVIGTNSLSGGISQLSKMIGHNTAMASKGVGLPYPNWTAQVRLSCEYTIFTESMYLKQIKQNEMCCNMLHPACNKFTSFILSS